MNESFKNHLLDIFPLDIAHSLINSLSGPEQRAALLNTDKISDEMFLSLFKSATPHPFVPHAYYYDKEIDDLGKHELHDFGAFYLQDPSAMIPASLLPVTNSDLVLDMCAAPGGKTIQVSRTMNNEGIIIANDISAARAKELSRNVERMGRKNIIVTNNNFEKFVPNLQNTFDAILLDAPCSGSGMGRKIPAILDEWSLAKVQKFASLQQVMIVNAYKYLKPGGTLIYSTCSFSPEENEEIISHLLANTDAELISVPTINGEYRPQNRPETLYLLPSLFKGEGQFIAMIKKTGEKIITFSKQTSTKFVYRDITYLLPTNYAIPALFYLVRPGLELGRQERYGFVPSHHYARASTSDESYALTNEEKNRYLSGETLQVRGDLPNGYHVVSYQGFAIGLVKNVNGVLKNHYPKGLRR